MVQSSPSMSVTPRHTFGQQQGRSSLAMMPPLSPLQASVNHSRLGGPHAAAAADPIRMESLEGLQTRMVVSSSSSKSMIVHLLLLADISERYVSALGIRKTICLIISKSRFSVASSTTWLVGCKVTTLAGRLHGAVPKEGTTTVVFLLFFFIHPLFSLQLLFNTTHNGMCLFYISCGRLNCCRGVREDVVYRNNLASGI